MLSDGQHLFTGLNKMNAGAHKFEILLVIISSILLKNGAIGQDDPPRPISGLYTPNSSLTILFHLSILCRCSTVF